MCNTIDESADENDQYKNKVNAAVEETFEQFCAYPQMFSTEGDCVAHLFRNIGNKKVNGRSMISPHPDTGACAIRREWKRKKSRNPIDIVIIDPRTFNFKTDEEFSKNKGRFGSAENHVVIEVKGPLFDKKGTKDDIDKVSGLLGEKEEEKFCNSGLVVQFIAKRSQNDYSPEIHNIKDYANSTNVDYYHEVSVFE